MIPWFFNFALITTIIVSLLVIYKQYDNKKSNLVLIIDMLIYLIFGISWSFVIFNGLITWWSVISSIIIGVFVSLIMGAFINAEDKPKINEKTYTPETLVGMRGIITNKYDETHYCGKLLDEYNTDIIVKIDKDCEEKCIFVITEINGFDIIAKEI